MNKKFLYFALIAGGALYFMSKYKKPAVNTDINNNNGNPDNLGNVNIDGDAFNNVE